MNINYNFNLFNKEGYLLNKKKWNKTIANQISNYEKIYLNKNHWKVINFLRKFYFKYNTYPNMKFLIKNLYILYNNKFKKSSYFFFLFPKGINQVIKISGLPKSKICL